MKGIRMNSNLRVKVLTEDQIDRIHEASLRILERTGMRFDCEDARIRLIRAGATPHPARRGVVTFPRSMVEDAIRHICHDNILYARDSRHDLRYDGEHLFPYAGGGDPKIVDLETGESRPSTLKDVEMAARLGDALEHNAFSSSLVMANDVPSELIVLKTMESAIRNSGKAGSGYAPDKDTVDFMVKMWACVAGGEEELRKRPIFSLGGSPSSPLTFSKHCCEALLRTLEHGIPYALYPCPICGETGPMTLGGALAQQNAEHLGGLILMQTVTTKLPTFYAGRVCVMDPRSGRDLWGVPEEGLMSAALVQIARRYSMVPDSNGMASDVTRWDMQIGFEQMMTGLMPVLAGAESVSGLGSGWEGASSLEMMVINNEAFEDIARLMRGIRVDDEALAVDLIDSVGHMGNFLAERHTMESIVRGELRVSSFWDRRTSEKARRDGHTELRYRAAERVREILAEHEPMPLERDVGRDLDAVMKAASDYFLRGKFSGT